MDKNINLNEVITEVSEMYRVAMREARRLSSEYDVILEELSNDEITHKKHTQLLSLKNIKSGEVNNQFHVAEGISNVREMLFELLK